MSEKVLLCRIVTKKNSFISDDVVSYKTNEDSVAVGDIFAAWKKGNLIFVQVDKVIPKWAYSDARTNAGNFDSMSWVINKVDVARHSILKEARAKIRDLMAAIAENVEKKNKSRAMSDAVKTLSAKDKAEIKLAQDAIASLEDDPEFDVGF